MDKIYSLHMNECGLFASIFWYQMITIIAAFINLLLTRATMLKILRIYFGWELSKSKSMIIMVFSFEN